MSDRPKPIQLACGFRSPEGPSFDRRGVLHIVDWEAQVVWRMTASGHLTHFVKTGGIPTGSKFHRDGRLFVADGDLGILAINPDGRCHVVVDRWAEGRFRGPNDLVFAQNGNLYFTDPRGSDARHPMGNVFLLRQNEQVEQFASGLQFPNGIVLSENEKTLYLAETSANRILAFELDDQGRNKSCRVFARLQGGLGPDGMAFGQDGNLYVAHFGRGTIAVIDPQGQLITELPAGGIKPTNVAFWGPSLYVTEVDRGQVVRLDIGVRGQVLYGLS